MRLALLALYMLVLATAPRAAQADWLGKAEGGFVMTQGNSDAKSANAKLDLNNEKGLWKHALAMSGLYGR
jgi:putative salt-induced outer membrane protein YdiY